MAPNLPPHSAPPHHWYDPQPRHASDRSDATVLRSLLVIVLLGIVLFALGHTMVAHHFFTGGALNNRSTSGPVGP